MSTSETIGKLAEALARAQGEIEDALRDSDNPFFGSSYADLASVWRACRKALTAHDLAVIQTTEYDEAGLSLRTVLAHASGEWVAGRYPVRPMKQTKQEGWVPSDDPQSTGSAITYARRYALAAMVGVAPAGDDDDGEKAMRRTPEERATAPALTIGFGRSKGMTPAELPNGDLDWYVKTYAENVADPAKARFKKQNQTLLDALKGEINRRQVAGDPPFDYEAPQANGDETAERAALIKSIKDYAARLKLSEADRAQAAETYLGKGVTPAKADLAALGELLGWLKARAGE